MQFNSAQRQQWTNSYREKACMSTVTWSCTYKWLLRCRVVWTFSIWHVLDSVDGLSNLDFENENAELGENQWTLVSVTHAIIAIIQTVVYLIWYCYNKTLLSNISDWEVQSRKTPVIIVTKTSWIYHRDHHLSPNITLFTFRKRYLLCVLVICILVGICESNTIRPQPSF